MDITPNSQWFYSKDGEQKGPVPLSELQSLLSNDLPASSLVWTEGAANWLPASSVPGLITQDIIDPSNPYAAPATDASLTQASNPLGNEEPPKPPIPLDIGFCLSQGWKHTFANFGNIALLGLVYIGVTFAIGMLFGIGQIAFGDAVTFDPDTGSSGEPSIPSIIYQIITTIIQNLVSIFLSIGVCKFGLNLLRGEVPQIGLLFSGKDQFLTALGATILYGLAVFVGLLLLIIPGIIIAVRGIYFLQAIVEKKLGAVDSLKYSWNLTRQNGLMVFLLGFVSILINIVGMLPCFLGLIVTIPFTWLAGVIAYRYLHAGEKGISVRQ
ncbi:GYF domain-containing protein [Akkermansiaceae bacterium]|nr:GYF domain-containing protein [Akkermansiaceae bacterium]